MEKSRVRLVMVLTICAIVISVLGIGMAYVVFGGGFVGGGYWAWETIPGLMAKSTYQHRSSYHSASAQVGSGSIVYQHEPPNVQATATARGVGTTSAWCNNQ